MDREKIRKLFTYIDSQKDRYIKELSELLSYPSTM